MSPRFRRVAVIVGTAGVLAAAAGCGGSAATSSSSPAPGAAGQPQQQGAAPGAPDLSALATKLGVSTARLQQAMQAARPSSPSTDAARPDPAAALAKALGLSEAKVRAAMQATMPAGGPQGQPRPIRPAEPAGPAAAAVGGPVGGMRLARGLTLALALLGPASAGRTPPPWASPTSRQPRMPTLAPGRSGLRYARLTVPVGRGDLAAARPSPGVAGRPWRAAGMAPHVAFAHLATDRCPAAGRARRRRAGPIRRRRPALRRGASRRCGPTRPGTRPTTASQPVAERPGGRRRLLRRVARRVREAAPWSRATSSTRGPTGRWLGALPARERNDGRGCGACTTTATSPTAVATGVDTVLATVPGALWIEETGGLVTLRGVTGRAGFIATEASAASAIDRAWSPRPTRGSGGCTSTSGSANATDRFDAGLVRPDGSARPSYATLARDLAAQRALRWRATWSTRRAGRLVLRATCTTSGRACRGRVAVSIAGRRVATRAYRTTARHPTAVLRVDVPRARRTARRVALLVRASRPSFPAQTLDLTVTTPTTRR